jgi:predicted nuclease of predicted toxin-antitoxin system
VTFKIDENLPFDAVGLLVEHGFDTHTVHDEGLLGAHDQAIAEAARRERRVLVTLDRDFSDIRAYPPADHAGIIILRPSAQDIRAVTELLRRLIEVLKRDSPEGELWIVEPDRIRRRSR